MRWRTLFHPAFVLTLMLLAVSALGMSAAIDAYGLHLRKLEIQAPGGRQVSALPRETPSWKQLGNDQIMDADTVKTLGTKNYVSRLYVRKGTESGDDPVILELHCAYYTGGIDTVPHVPERCMIGGGWLQTKTAEIKPLEMDSSLWVKDASASNAIHGDVYTARTLAAPYSDAPGTRVRLPFGIGPERPFHMRISAYMDPERGQSLYAGYFFIANGGTVASAENVRTLAFDLTSDYAYYLKVQVSGSGFDSVDEMASQASSLLSELIAEIMRCVPDWTQVESGAYPDDRRQE